MENYTVKQLKSIAKNCKLKIISRLRKAELISKTQASVARGTFGSPTFFVGDEIYFGKDKLRDVEEEIDHQRNRA